VFRTTPEETLMPQDGSRDETVFASAEDPDWLPPEINTGVAHSARVYDYLLGGKDNFRADREGGDGLIAALPSAPVQARENRAFLGRAIRYLAGQAGIRQFLDIGTGIPAVGNTHEVAQAAAPDSRIVYVDNDRCKSGCVHTCRSGRPWCRRPLSAAPNSPKGRATRCR
jgi:hypothetical protein